MNQAPLFGVIGGSGLYAMPDLTDIESYEISTPFGEPSTPVLVGSLAGHRVAFLARHGHGHTINPSEINYRANIYALKSLGVRRVISVSACGSLREDYAPGHMVVPDNLFDFTKGRKKTFFEDGLVAHVGVADPFCAELSQQTYDACAATGAATHRGGTFITIEGPRFSTRGESLTFRNWDMAIIGMTTSPEAYLAREAEIAYAVMAHVTDYDSWHATEEAVTVEMVIKTMNANITHAQQALRNLVAIIAENEAAECTCESALAAALITNPTKIPGETRAKLDLLVKKYL